MAVIKSNSYFIAQVYFQPGEVHACVVTCGGLCPGLNTVIREIVCGLYHMYGVTKVIGIDVSEISWYYGCHKISCHHIRKSVNKSECRNIIAKEFVG